MNKLRLTIAGPVPIGGHQPGEEFTVPCDAKGVPTDVYWRRRLRDEMRHAIGAVLIVEEKKMATKKKEPSNV